MSASAASTTHSILVLQGPNLNLLGAREPEVYGTDTLADIHARIESRATELGLSVGFLQSNAEHELVDALHAAPAQGVKFVIINPGAFTHTSVALRDAFLGVALPFIEVHLSNVHAREEFRQVSYLSDVAVAVITGLGADGYLYAVDAAAARLA